MLHSMLISFSILGCGRQVDSDLHTPLSIETKSYQGNPLIERVVFQAGQTKLRDSINAFSVVGRV
jgi:hypothetical protein